MESETEHKAKQLSLAGPATSIIFVATNTFFCFFVVVFLFVVATKVSIWRQNLSRQIFFVEGAQIMFVATNISRYKSFVTKKHNFVSTNVLSRQAYFYRDKRRVCRNKTLS